MIVMIIGLFMTIAWAFRSLCLTWNFQIISARIPVMHQPLEDPSVQGNLRKMQATKISKTTPMIILGYKSMLLGDLQAFTEGHRHIRNKIEIPHAKGSPQIGRLIQELEKWRSQRSIRFKRPPSDIAVLLPGEQSPVAVIMQIISYLKTSGLYKEIVLGAEIY